MLIAAPGLKRNTCGLDNISFGLPQRDLLNESFLALCFAAGLDAAIVVLTKRIGAILKSLQALSGGDDYCVAYLQAFRDQELEV